MVETKRIIGKWIAGGAVSVLAIWAVTAICQPNIVPERWSEPFQRNVPAEGWSFSHRAENWATTHFGPEGFRGMKDLQGLQGPSAIIWGDSFVEAYQVDDADKMDARLNALLLNTEGENLTVASVGHSWWSVADYYFLIPRYEAFLPDCRLHVIHLFTLQDLLPDQDPRGCMSLFLSNPTFHFEEFGAENRGLPIRVEQSKVKEIVYGAKLHFLLELRNKVAALIKMEGLRFTPGTAENRSESLTETRGVGAWRFMLKNVYETGWTDAPPPIEAWKFLLAALKERTQVPIVFVYCPATPSMSRGEIILNNPERELAKSFSSLCAKSGYGFIDVESDFLDYWEKKRKLPRGFHTSRPGEGHYNADGHRIVAEAIYRWLNEHRDVVHPN